MPKRKRKGAKKCGPLQRCTFCGHRSSLGAWRSFHGCYFCGQEIVEPGSLVSEMERRKQRKGAE